MDGIAAWCLKLLSQAHIPSFHGRSYQMKSAQRRIDLPTDVADALAGLFQYLRAPAVVATLLERVLSPEESRRICATCTNLPMVGVDRLSPRTILDVVAAQRQLTYERTMLDLAQSLDLIGVGRYEQLRRAIGEPITIHRCETPDWNSVSNELRFRGELVRTVSTRAVDPRRILDAFQNDGWPVRIDSPIPGGTCSQKLRQAVFTLNKGLMVLRFFCDGSGEGVLWEKK
jgi:hypothetical protein